MTAERALSPRLGDMVEAADKIRFLLEGGSLQDFENDWQKRWLVERGVEIISEASRHLPEEVKRRWSEIPWRKVAGIGNILRHEYQRVAPDLLWTLAQADLPALERVCRAELAIALQKEQLDGA